MKTLVIDNYDSFTYNLVHLLEALGEHDVTVRRNDKTTLEEVSSYRRILLSPGPGIPKEAGLMPEIVRAFAGKIPILGVCLGHQCIGEEFGATLENLTSLYHGKPCEVTCTVEDNRLFRGLPRSFVVGRYHSWAVMKEAFPSELEVTAESSDGVIMALRHRSLAVQGVQFHPESVLTPDGPAIMRNWLDSTSAA